MPRRVLIYLILGSWSLILICGTSALVWDHHRREIYSEIYYDFMPVLVKNHDSVPFATAVDVVFADKDLIRSERTKRFLMQLLGKDGYLGPP